VSPLQKKVQVVAHTCNPSYSAGRDQKDCSSKLAWVNFRDPISKIPNTKKGTGGVAQAVEHLPSKCEAQSSKLQHQKKSTGFSS
jgi:hypothetical protein